MIAPIQRKKKLQRFSKLLLTLWSSTRLLLWKMTRKMRLAVKPLERMRMSTSCDPSALWDMQSIWRTNSEKVKFLCWFFTMNPPDLRYIVKTTILKYLVCSSDISRDHVVMLEYLRGWGQGVFGDEILTQIIEDFPSQLTDELLVILSPPHLRHLKVTNCTRLSCNGLQKTVAKYVCYLYEWYYVLSFASCISCCVSFAVM